MKSKLQLEVLRRFTKRHSSSPSHTSGYTLVEVLVVVAVLCLLTAVALPNYLRARNRSEAGAVVGELTGLAKECALANAMKMQEVVNVNGVSYTCNGAALTITGRRFIGPVDAVVCLGTTASTSVTIAYVAVSAAGSMSCSFS